MSKIEWTEKTWNPIVGCSVVSPGCTNCYAMRMAHRLGQNSATPHYAGLTQMSRGGPVWTGKLALAPEHVLAAPVHRKKPTTWFVNSMGDLFHEDVPDEWIDQVFAVMALCPQHRFQVLTKRADRMQEYVPLAHRRIMEEACDIALDMNLRVALSAVPWQDEDAETIANLAGAEVVRLHQYPLPNVWLGVSAEDQTRADERIPQLLETPAAVRFVSAEPLLGQVNLTEWLHESACWIQDGGAECTCHPPDEICIDWVIVGGESGPFARPMHPDWARMIRDQYTGAGVPFFFKQWGEFVSVSEIEGPGDHHKFPDGATVRRTGKKLAGRTLDGRVWDQMPKVVQ
ncbi:MAG: phage Gp37/Gp68 family protein [Roseovarius sp.]|uniref:DUF5131 family protein n=1 Tax=Roseovarius sp. TaxID=1486281 RepID=UPI0032EE7DE9